MYICTYAHMHMHTSLYIYMYVCVSVHMYVYIYIISSISMFIIVIVTNIVESPILSPPPRHPGRRSCLSSAVVLAVLRPQPQNSAV